MTALVAVVAESIPRLLEAAWLTVKLVTLALLAGTALAFPRPPCGRRGAGV